MTKLYIIHGWTYDLDKWHKILPLLKNQGFEPVMLKVPGLTEPSTKVWTINDYIEWLDKKLDGVKDPIVIGHSNGGRIALSYLQKYPGRFKQLILIDSAGVADQTLKRKAKLQTLKVISKIGKPLKKVPVVNKAFYKIIGAQDYRNAPQNMRETMQNMLAADKQLDLSKVSVPLTLIWGSDDAHTPLKDGHKIQQSISGSKLHVVKGARHAPHHTHAQEVADLITRAVKE